MHTVGVFKAVLAFDVASYVRAARAEGRGSLDPALRQHMAELYEDLRKELPDGIAEVSRAEARQLRLAELVLQNEWKLLDTGTDDGIFQPSPDALPEYRGRRNLSYANMRLLNETLGVRRHTSDEAIEVRCREAIAFLVDSWLAHEERTAAGVEDWCGADLPDDAELTERIARLKALRARVARDVPPLAAAPEPPARWSGYAGPAGRGNVLEYLVNLPYGRRHDEGAFLRTIHLTEVATWAILARVISAVEWIREGHAAGAVGCLDRATDLAEIQLDVLRILRRTLSVERFLAFREDTGDSSAVQSVGSQLLHIHLLGVHPRKVDALAAVRENEYLLLHRSRGFTPLWAALNALPPDETAAEVLAAAYRLDDALFRWRRMHLGLAHRYLPEDTAGTGGTSGASYLQAFYRDRMFDVGGRLRPYAGETRPITLEPRVRGRPAFFVHN